MSRFDPSVLSPHPERRALVLDWLEAGLAAVDPARVTAEALTRLDGARMLVVAIGKAAPAMSRGAATVVDLEGGLCVCDHVESAPPEMVFMVGDHPVPGPASLKAGQAALSVVTHAPPGLGIVALISGGGSALCESPRPGVPAGYLTELNRRLVDGGADIEEINLVRAHLSAIKGGGLARAAGRPIDTYVISDVAGADPGVVASGPTVPLPHQPERARQVLERLGIGLPDAVWEAMRARPLPAPMPRITLVADAHDAARGIAAAVGAEARVLSEWLHGPVEAEVDGFLAAAGPGVTVAVGETVISVADGGRGGRNTHAALLAATRIAGGDDVFVAFASDGVDGRSEAAGAMVDGSTLERGGDPQAALAGYDSASYLSATGDLLRCEPTGTNVSDIWILWRRAGSALA